MAAERWLCVDPGETTGWSIWRDRRCLGGGQTPLWPFAHDVWTALVTGDEGDLGAGERYWLRADPEENQGPITLMVVEKFALYPEKALSLAWDELRTVQLIGALTFMAQLHDVRLHKQPASIKERAMAGGAGELFISPVHENRHQNDSIMHGHFYSQVEMAGEPFKVRDGAAK